MTRKEDSTERLRAMTEKYERGLVVNNELNMRINVLEHQLLEGERVRAENMRYREEIQRLMRTVEESETAENQMSKRYCELLRDFEQRIADCDSL